MTHYAGIFFTSASKEQKQQKDDTADELSIYIHYDIYIYIISISLEHTYTHTHIYTHIYIYIYIYMCSQISNLINLQLKNVVFV